MTARLSADYHKKWTADAEPELRRIVRERDETIRELREEVERLAAMVERLTKRKGA